MRQGNRNPGHRHNQHDVGPLGGLTVGGQYGRRLARSGDTCRLVLALGEPATR